MIRNWIVVGSQGAVLLEKLHLEQELTLELAIAKIQQLELIKRQQTTVRGEEQNGITLLVFD